MSENEAQKKQKNWTLIVIIGIAVLAFVLCFIPFVPATCESCNGSGRGDESTRCITCEGKGRLWAANGTALCFNCNGDGKHWCRSCVKTGKVNVTVWKHLNR